MKHISRTTLSNICCCCCCGSWFSWALRRRVRALRCRALKEKRIQSSATFLSETNVNNRRVTVITSRDSRGQENVRGFRHAQGDVQVCDWKAQVHTIPPPGTCTIASNLSTTKPLQSAPVMNGISSPHHCHHGFSRCWSNGWCNTKRAL